MAKNVSVLDLADDNVHVITVPVQAVRDAIEGDGSLPDDVVAAMDEAQSMVFGKGKKEKAYLVFEITGSD